MSIAVHRPQRRQRHRPMAAVTHAAHTAAMSNIAHKPSGARPARAPGFSRHSGSNGLPGNRNMMVVSPLMIAPNTKNQLIAVIPGGRLGVGIRLSLQRPLCVVRTVCQTAIASLHWELERVMAASPDIVSYVTSGWFIARLYEYKQGCCLILTRTLAGFGYGRPCLAALRG